MQQATAPTLASFKREIRVGTILRCLENTYSLTHGVERAGKLATITKAGVNVFTAEMDGKPYRMTFPTRKSDVVAITPDTITYRVGRDDHTVTWQIITDHEHCANGTCWQDRYQCPAS